MNDGYNGVYSQIFNGIGYPFILSYTAQNLTTGLPYRFKLKAYNINGGSIDSGISTIYTCLKTGNITAPTKVTTSNSSITIAWTKPLSNGCPLDGFEIYRDTGNSDTLSIQVDPSNV